jgi:uncharacterized membrane protein
VTTNDELIEVNAPLATVYRQWAQVESYRYFLDGVLSVERTGPTTMHWVVAADGDGSREFDAQITEEVEGRRFAWAATSGPAFTATVTLDEVDRVTTRVRLETEADGAAPTGGASPGDLARFKDYLEASGDETAAWQAFTDRG